jgi:UDP-glucose 4-epimerase
VKTILTGAEGNLGKRILEQSKLDCLPISRTTWGSLDNIHNSEYQALIHCAYDLKTDFNQQPDDVLESNVISTGKALRICREKSVGKFVFISSCSVYGDSANTNECRPCQPVTINGYTKLFNEELVKSFCAANAIDYLILRVFNSYGGDDHFSVVQKLVKCANRQGPFVLINDGLAERDFIHVDDVARITCELVAKDVVNDIINVGSGRSVRIIDLLKAVEKKFGKMAVITEKRSSEMIYSRANISKLEKLVNFQVGDIFDFIHTMV